jgi:hypothetical protein
MYFEEKIINGKLCYRSSPNVEFKEYSQEDLTEMIIQLRLKVFELSSIND